MSEPMMWLDHGICLSCGSVRDEFVRVNFDGNGMKKGDYAFPLIVTAEYARAISREGRCGICKMIGRFQLALRPMEPAS